MSVLIDASCLVIPAATLAVQFLGGVDYFVGKARELVQPRYVVSDDTLVTVSVWSPQQLIPLIELLAQAGLALPDETGAGDFALVDMDIGRLTPCSWLDSEVHRHGFRWAWHTGQAAGEMAFPDEWRPQQSWSLDRSRLQDAGADAVLPLGTTDAGDDVVLDFRTGQVVSLSNATSPIVSVPAGGAYISAPALEDIRLATAQLLLRLREIPYRVDKELGAIIVMFSLDEMDPEDARIVGTDGLMRILFRVGDAPRRLQLDVQLPLPSHHLDLVVPSLIHEAAAAVTAKTGGTFDLCEETGTMSVHFSVTVDPETSWADGIARVFAFASYAGTRMCVGLAVDS